MIEADLVVDATGRNSRIKERLVEIGARSPVDVQLDNSTIYYTRYYRSPSGELPDYSGGAGFIGGQSIGLFWIPAHNATWCLSVWGAGRGCRLAAVAPRGGLQRGRGVASPTARSGWTASRSATSCRWSRRGT